MTDALSVVVVVVVNNNDVANIISRPTPTHIIEVPLQLSPKLLPNLIPMFHNTAFYHGNETQSNKTPVTNC